MYRVRFLDLVAAQTPPSKELQQRIKRARSQKQRARLLAQRASKCVVEIAVRDAPNQYRAQTLAWDMLTEKIGKHASSKDFTLFAVVWMENAQ